MISSTVARSYSGSPLLDLVRARVGTWFKNLRRHAYQWHERSVGRWELRKLTERDLRDIGLTRSEAEAEANKPFWQA